MASRIAAWSALLTIVVCATLIIAKSSQAQSTGSVDIVNHVYLPLVQTSNEFRINDIGDSIRYEDCFLFVCRGVVTFESLTSDVCPVIEESLVYYDDEAHLSSRLKESIYAEGMTSNGYEVILTRGFMLELPGAVYPNHYYTVLICTKS